MRLLNVDHLSTGVNGAMNAYFLAFELRHFVLVVEIIGISACCILKHILIARFYDCAGEGLDSRTRLRLSVG